MKPSGAILAIGLVLLATPVHSAVTFDFIFDGGYPLAASKDGSVIAGNLSNGGFGPFRWTQATGPMSLGRVTHVGGGGAPGISEDGSRVASSIASLDSSSTMQGLWTLGSGWQELLPMPADGYNQDGTVGNVYGLSGDGNTVVGLYPRLGGRAHACKWTPTGGTVDLGGTTHRQASRANGVNYNGSVIVGWVETPLGPWRPAAWVNGSCLLLTSVDTTGLHYAGSGEARATSPSGDFIVGFVSDSVSQQRAAVMWTRTNGVFGPTQLLGWVNGTTPQYGINVPAAVSANGKVVVGYCSFDGDPFFTTGFIWTPATGVIDINEYLADNGVFTDPNFVIQSMSAMTPDGKQLFGYGQQLTPPYTRRAFRISVPSTLDAPTPSVTPGLIALSAARPNPSAGETQMELALPATVVADVSVFDAAGRRVTTLVHGELAAGRHSIRWDGRESDGKGAAAGMYFARLTTPQGAITRRIVRVR